jgi:long-chain acyl-CoA synthetase
VPRIYEFRQELPKTAVGKILRRALVEEEKKKIEDQGQKHA